MGPSPQQIHSPAFWAACILDRDMRPEGRRKLEALAMAYSDNLAQEAAGALASNEPLDLAHALKSLVHAVQFCGDLAHATGGYSPMFVEPIRAQIHQLLPRLAAACTGSTMLRP